MKILDPVVGGKIRAVLRLIAFAVPLVAGAVGYGDAHQVALALGIVAALDTLIGFATHSTDFGNVVPPVAADEAP